VSLLDIFATLGELAGLEAMPHTDSHSLLPLMRSQDARRPSPVITTWIKGNHSIRQEHWRYTRYTDATEELYDLATDPHEWINLAADPAFRHVCDRLRSHIPTSG